MSSVDLHPRRRCRIPECENTNASIEKPSWWPSDVDSQCYKPILFNKAPNRKACSNTSFTRDSEECEDWIYENNNSIVAELNLACQPWKINLVGGVHNAGMIVSTFITGWIADRIGRKPTLIICSVGASIGVFKIFTTIYYQYIALEFLESVLGSGLFTVGAVLLIEVGGRTKRVLAGVIFSYAQYLGDIFFAILAMTLQYWKWLVLIVYAPMILFILYIFPLKESTRWQMLRGRTNDAKKTLAMIAKMNKIKITENEIAGIDDKELRARLNVEEQKHAENIKVIFNSRAIMTRLCVIAFCFFTSSFLYNGSLVHAVLLPGNKYTNFILAALTSFPGELIAYYTFNKYGRRITLQCGYLLSAVFLLAHHYCPVSITWLKLSLFMVSKLGMVICFTGIYTYSLELFPTSVRGTLLGCGHTAARIGGMLAPLTPLLITDMPALPSILFSTTALISAALLTLTPETKELPMFDTIAQIDSWKSNNLPGINNLPVVENTNNIETSISTIISTKL